jgi:hypothetical protein
MEERRWLTIHFIDGSEKQFDFPVQDIDLSTLEQMLEKALLSDKLVLEVEGVMYVFPHNNIKYIRVSPCPELLPDITVRGVRLVD